MTLYYKRKKRKFSLIFIFPLILILLTVYIYAQITPIFIQLCEEKLYAITFELLNTIISQKISQIGTDNLIQYKYDNSGNLSAVNANVVIMNTLNSEISKEIIVELSNIGDIYIKLPIGSLVNSDFFSGIGPVVPLKILPLSTVTTEYSTDFSSTGINQSRHRIFIKVNCSITVLSRLTRTTQQINIEIPIAETIIIGNVPQTLLQIPQ